MKSLVIACLLLACTRTSSQTFVLENHYLDGNVKRINLDYSGPKYFVIDQDQHTILLFNPDHTLWKSVALPIPSGFQIYTVPHISELKIDSEPDLEIAFSYIDSAGVIPYPFSRIVSEEGTIIMSNDGLHYEFSDIEGLETKLLVYETPQTHIFHLSDLTEENSFDGKLKRIKLEISGEKYYQYNVASSSIDILNSDLSLWKSIPVVLEPNMSNVYIYFLSELEVNNDPVLELGYQNFSNTGQGGIAKIVNEDGEVLFSVNNAGIRVDKIDGLENKLFVTYSGQMISPTNVYSLPDFTLEHVYPTEIWRTKLEDFGEAFYTTNLTIDGPAFDTIIINNSNHDFWKSFFLPSPDLFSRPFKIQNVSRTKFAADDKVEVIYSTINDVLIEGGYSESRIINESGEVLLIVPNSLHLYLDETPGWQPRLIADLSIGEFINPVDQGKVFIVDNTMATDDWSTRKIAIYPNPASHYVEISSPALITDRLIYSVSGQVIYADKAESSRIDLENWNPGLYFLVLTDENDHVTVHKLLISR